MRNLDGTGYRRTTVDPHIAKMAIVAPQTKTYTTEDYLTLEVASDIRNEFRNGDIVEMTGGDT